MTTHELEMRMAVVRAALLYLEEHGSDGKLGFREVLRGCDLVLRDVTIRAGDDAPRSDDGRAPRRWTENPIDQAFAEADRIA